MMTALASPLRPSARVAEGFVPAPRLRSSPFALYDGSFRGAVLAGRAGPDRQVAAFHSNRSITQATDRHDAASGIERVLPANRDRPLRLLRLRGAGAAAEPLSQDLWMGRHRNRTDRNAPPHA